MKRLVSKTFSAATLLIAVLAPVAATADDNPYSDRGFFVGVGGVYANNLFEQELKDLVGFVGPVTSLTDSGGVNVRAGYRALSWLALEAQYEWVDGLGVVLANTIEVAEFRPQSVTANIKWILPFWRIQPYALTGFGVAFWEVETIEALGGEKLSGTGFAARLGIGADFYITENLALTAEGAGVLNTQEFQFTDSSLDKLYYFSVSGGLLVHF